MAGLETGLLSISKLLLGRGSISASIWPLLTIHGYETIFQVSNFAGSTEAVFKTLEKEFQELERYV